MPRDRSSEKPKFDSSQPVYVVVDGVYNDEGHPLKTGAYAYKIIQGNQSATFVGGVRGKVKEGASAMAIDAVTTALREDLPPRCNVTIITNRDDIAVALDDIKRLRANPSAELPGKFEKALWKPFYDAVVRHTSVGQIEVNKGNALFQEKNLSPTERETIKDWQERLRNDCRKEAKRIIPEDFRRKEEDRGR